MRLIVCHILEFINFMKDEEGVILNRLVISRLRTILYNLAQNLKVKVKLSLQQAVKAHRFVKRRGSHIF
jgi:hypothetical protein